MEESKSKKINQNFFEKNFILYTGIIRKDYYTYYQMLFLISFSMLQFISTHLHSYKFFSNSKERYLIVFVDASTYLNIFNLLVINEGIYLFLFLTINIISLIYFSIYIYLIIYRQKKIMKIFMGRVFKHLTKYYFWLLYFPNLVINFSRIFCSDIIFNNLKNETCRNYNLRNVFLLLFSILNIIFSTLMVLMSSIFYTHSIYNKKDNLSTNSDYFILGISIKKFLIGIIITAPLKNNVTFFVIISFFISLIFLAYFIRVSPFDKEFTSKLMCAFLSAFFACCSGIFANEITKKYFFSSSNCIFFILFLLLIIEPFLFFYIRKYKKELILFSLKEEKASFIYFSQHVMFYQNFLSSFEDLDNLFYKGLVQNHVENCLDSYCFCKKKTIFDSKKEKEFSVEKSKNLKKVFGKMILKFRFENFIKFHPSEVNAYIMFAEFLFERMENLHLASIQLNNVERKFLMPFQKYKIYRLKDKFSRRNKKLNNFFHGGKLLIETVVLVEENLEKV